MRPSGSRSDDGRMEQEPAGQKTREQRRDRMAREHPVRFTLQRVAIAVGEVLLGVLGVGAVITVFMRGLLPPVSIPVPEWLRDLRPPDWLRYVDPLYWLGRLDIPWPDVDLPGWLTGSTKYWVPIVVALVIALGEIDRRRKAAERE